MAAFSEFATVLDPEKGRCLVSNKIVEVGSILWEEKALVASSVTESLEDPTAMLVDRLADLPRVQSEDTALNLLKLVSLVKSGGLAVHPSRALFDELQATNVEECVRNLEQLRRDFGSEADLGLPDAEIGRLLGILNSNQVELEAGGAGLFVFTAIMEHSCEPNCSFTTHEDTLYMCAIRPISVGDRLSIDYVNGFYRCAAARKKDLMYTYSFTCSCPCCTAGHDPTRAFWCSAKGCSGGAVFCPVVDGDAWTACNACGALPTEGAVGMFLTLEDKLAKKDVWTVEQVQALRRTRRGLHEAHYVYFWALYDMALESAQEFPDEAAVVFEELIRVMETYRVTPEVHHENVLLLDRLGQVQAKSGDFVAAQATFKRAYEASVLACGGAAPLSCKLKDFAPRSLEDLLRHYSH